MAFIDWDYTEVLARYPTFDEFLRHDLEITRKLIAQYADSVSSGDEKD